MTSAALSSDRPASASSLSRALSYCILAGCPRLMEAAAQGRFIHTGIIGGVQEEERVHERDVHVCVTVEGNTTADGSANGHTTLPKVRTFREAEGHRFIRWAEMVQRAVAA